MKNILSLFLLLWISPGVPFYAQSDPDNRHAKGSSATAERDHISEATADFFAAVEAADVPAVRILTARFETILAKLEENDVAPSRAKASVLFRLGEANALLGKASQSLVYFERAATERNGSGDQSSNARERLWAICVRYVLKKPEEAELEIRNALSDPEKTSDPVSEWTALILNGGVSKALGKKAASIASYEAALNLSSKQGDKFAEGYILEKLADAIPERRNELLIQAVAAYRGGEQDANRTNETVVPRILISLGDSISAFNRADAVQFMGPMSDEEKRAFIEKPRGLGIPLVGVGDRGRGPYALARLGLQFLKTDRPAALKTYQEALEWSRSANSDQAETIILGYITGFFASPRVEDAFQFYFSLQSLGVMYNASRSGFYTTGNARPARGTIEYGLISIENARRKFKSEALRSSYSLELQRFYERFIDLLMEMEVADPTGGHGALAFRTAELSRSRTLVDLLKEAEVDLQKDANSVLLARQREIQIRLNELADRQERFPPQSRDRGTSEKLNDEISALVAEYSEIHGTIRQKKLQQVAQVKPTVERVREVQRDFMLSLGTYYPVDPLPVTMGDLQRELTDDDTILLEFFLSAKKSYLWAVSSTASSSFSLPNRATVEKIARELYAYSQNPNDPPNDAFAKTAQKLSNMVLGPVAQQIKGKRLVIVTDGALQYVPFSALPSPAVQAISSHKGVPLAVTNEIVNLPSATVLTVLRRESVRRRQKGIGIAIIADPVFSGNDDRFGVTNAPQYPSKEPELSRLALERAFAFRIEEGKPFVVPRLPFTRREAKSIFALAPQNQSINALDFNADREKLLKTDLSKYRIIHFATHGILHSEHPELSGIVLSLLNEKGEPVNGFLRLNEIYNMNLNADLVVLSACQTALGKEVRGEGLIGLTRGFMYAGSPRVVASLWKVDDVATAELMKIFYTKMLKEKMRPAAALRAAKIEMMKQKRFAAPYYWAAFELQGEWR